MKNNKIQLIVFIAITFCIYSKTSAQEAITDTSYWSREGTIGLNFTQIGLKNWAGGGESSIAFGSLFNYNAKYEKDVHLWQNRLELAYGIQRFGGKDESFKKTDDYLIVFSQYGRKLSKKWFFTGLLDFRTQFTKGYKFSEDPATNEEVKEKISSFMAPGYMKVGLGLTYQTKLGEAEEDFFSFTISPLTGKITFVSDDELSASGAYGVEPGEKSRIELGTNIVASIKKNLMKNVSFQSNLALFSAYDSYGNVDVNWDALLVLKVNDYITSSISTQLIYDDDIILEKSDGEMGRAVQFKNVLNIGFAYKF